MERVLKILRVLKQYFKIKFELGQDDDPATPEEEGLLATVKIYQKVKQK